MEKTMTGNWMIQSWMQGAVFQITHTCFINSFTAKCFSPLQVSCPFLLPSSKNINVTSSGSTKTSLMEKNISKEKYAITSTEVLLISHWNLNVHKDIVVVVTVIIIIIIVVIIIIITDVSTRVGHSITSFQRALLLYHSPLSSLLSVVHLPTLGFSVLSLIYP
jgi:hypothetical protein